LIRIRKAASVWANEVKNAVQAVDMVHRISPNMPVMIGVSASSRKGVLIEMQSWLLSGTKGAPEEMRDRSCFLADATLKAIRVGLTHYHRVTVTCDEIVNTMDTPWSENRAGGHALSRSKLNTYSQCEKDDVMTANGKISFTDYSLQIKLAGQYEAVEFCLRPSQDGWQKRISFALSPMTNTHDDSTDASYSLGLFRCLHQFMYEGPYNLPENLHYDPFAITMWQTVRDAIAEWLDENCKEPSVSRWFIAKILFADSDILRMSAQEMRKVQFLASLCENWTQEPHRQAINKFEFAAGLRKTFRQWSLHHGYYTFDKWPQSGRHCW